MADVPITIYRSEKVRSNTRPSNPDFPEDQVPDVENPPGTGPISHNSTANKQGGDSANNFYGHTSEDELDAIQGAAAPSASNVFATMADVGGGGADSNAVHYNAADGKNGTEKRQARTNIGSTASEPQTASATGTVNNLVLTSNCLYLTGGITALSGMIPETDGQEVAIVNLTSVSVSLLLNNTGSSSSYRFRNSGVLRANSYCIAKHVSSISGWLLELAGSDDRYLLKNTTDSGTIELTTNGVDFISTGEGNTSRIFRIYDSLGVLLFALNRRGDFDLQMTRSASRFRIKDFAGATNFEYNPNGTLFHLKSSSSIQSVRRDELPYNYPQTVVTTGIINDQSLTDEGVKLLILTLADELTGVIPVTTTTGRLLRIENRKAGTLIIRHESASSTAANRFSLPSSADINMNQNDIYTFIYTNSRWKRVV